MIIFLRDARKASTGALPQDRAGYLRDAYWRGCVPHAGVRAWVVTSEVPGLAGRHPGALPADSAMSESGSKSGSE